ncbi:hypothetical protein HMPREF1215_00710 [Coprococcus sp. HPP0074]|nr:hypothetical protein HMPREF1215_00710 [Coprococcus sp. HPP0074]
MKRSKLYGTTFCGNEASDYAKEQGYLDYATFAKAFDAVLNNSIMENTCEVGFWEQENGIIDNSEEINELNEKEEELSVALSNMVDEGKDDSKEYQEIEKERNEIVTQIENLEEEQEQSYNQDIFQYFIVSDQGVEMIKQYTDDPLFYNETLDMYVWGITHFGTSWNYVLTDVKLNCGQEAFE